MIKIAPGGIVETSFFPFIGNSKTELVDVIDKKIKKIYYRTKNRRIKKKQLKKSFMLSLEVAIKKTLKNVKSKDLKIIINNVKEIDLEEVCKKNK